MDRVVRVLEVMIIVVNSILGNLNDHFITFWPSTWSWASHSGSVDELDKGLLWWKLKSSWSESALKVLWIGVVGKLVSHEVNLFTTFD